MSKVILEFNTDEDSATRINAAIKADLLALCIYELREKIRSLNDSDELSDEVLESLAGIIENRIGYIDDYTE